MTWQICIDQKSDKDLFGRALSIAANRERINEEREPLICGFGKDEYMVFFGGKLVDHYADIGALSKRPARNFPEKRKSMEVGRLGESHD